MGFKDWALEIIVGVFSVAVLLLNGLGTFNGFDVKLILWINLGIVVFSVISKIATTRDQKRVAKDVEKILTTATGTDKVVNAIKEEKEKKIEQLEDQNKLIAKLVNEGLISEKAVYDKIKKKNFFYFFCYGNVHDQTAIQKILGRDFRNPTLTAIESIGFFKVGRRHNFYILPADYLSKRLNNTKALELVIRKVLKKHWKAFLTGRIFCIMRN